MHESQGPDMGIYNANMLKSSLKYSDDFAPLAIYNFFFYYIIIVFVRNIHHPLPSHIITLSKIRTHEYISLI